MQFIPHDIRLKKFAKLISPIAEKLKFETRRAEVAIADIAASTVPANDSIRPFDSQFAPNAAGPRSQTSPESSPESSSDSSLDSGGFFQPSELHASTEPMSLPSPLQSRAAKMANEPVTDQAFEYLRQHIMRRRSREFVNLSAREQALAKVGGLLSVHRESFGQRIYHFSQNNVLIAVLDRPRHRFYMRRDVPAMDYSDLSHIVRPDVAGAASAEFEAMPVQDAIWLYAQLDAEAMLDVPPDMGVNWLQLRRLPAVSPRLMTDHHMQIIRKLLTRQQRFELLRIKTAKDLQPNLVSDLACLYLTRSLAIIDNASQSITSRALPMKVRIR
jgi:hypothetical protein